MELPVLLVASVLGSKAEDDGSGVQLECEGVDGERFIIALPAHSTTTMQVALQDAAADAQQRGGRVHIAPIVDRIERQPSPVPGRELLTLWIEGGMKAVFLVPAGAGSEPG